MYGLNPIKGDIRGNGMEGGVYVSVAAKSAAWLGWLSQLKSGVNGLPYTLTSSSVRLLSD